LGPRSIIPRDELRIDKVLISPIQNLAEFELEANTLSVAFGRRALSWIEGSAETPKSQAIPIELEPSQYLAIMEENFPVEKVCWELCS